MTYDIPENVINALKEIGLKGKDTVAPSFFKSSKKSG